MPKVNPLTLEKWTPADDETLQSVMAGKLPDVFRGSQPKPQPVPTPAGHFLTGSAISNMTATWKGACCG